MKFEPPARGSEVTTVWGTRTLTRATVLHATKHIVLLRAGASSRDEVLPEHEGQTWVRGWEGPAVEALKTVVALSPETSKRYEAK